MPGSMGWLDSNKANTSDESSSDYSDSESETSDSDVSDSDLDEQGSGAEEEDGGESSSESDGSDNSSIGDSVVAELVADPELPDQPPSNRNSMLDSIMKDFDDQSKDLFNSSIASSQPSMRGEILI